MSKINKSKSTAEEIADIQRLTLTKLEAINQTHYYKRTTYDLQRGELCEQMVVELLQSLGIDAGRYHQKFPPNAGHLIRSCQVDLWVRGGTSGRIYQLETKTRGCRSGSIFDFNPIALGGCETWDEKNAAIATKAGRKPVLGMIVVCQNTGDVLVTNCLPERQKLWKRVSFGKELSYAVERYSFIDLVAFSKYLKTI